MRQEEECSQRIIFESCSRWTLDEAISEPLQSLLAVTAARSLPIPSVLFLAKPIVSPSIPTCTKRKPEIYTLGIASASENLSHTRHTSRLCHKGDDTSSLHVVGACNSIDCACGEAIPHAFSPFAEETIPFSNPTCTKCKHALRIFGISGASGTTSDIRRTGRLYRSYDCTSSSYLNGACICIVDWR